MHLLHRLNGASLRLPPLRERADQDFLIRRLFDELQAELGLSRPTIYRRMKRLGIAPPQYRDGV